MKRTTRNLIPLAIVLLSSSLLPAQAPAPAKGGPGKGGPRLVFWVTSPAWADGAEVPMKYSGRGENKSPAFEFHWNLGTNPASAPEGLQSYAVIFHDLENSTNKTTTDTLHWAAFNIPGTAKGLPEGLGPGTGRGSQPAAARIREPTLAPAPAPDRFIIMCSSSMLSIQSWNCRRIRPATSC